MDLPLIGTIRLDKTGLRVMVDYDFGKYYKTLISAYFCHCRPLFLPKHGMHVTILNVKVHGDRFTTSMPIMRKYDGRKVNLTYSNDIREGGRDFRNYWVPVKFELGDIIKKECGIRDRPGFMGYHITIANDKNA
jgi:hypothetical protein